MEKGRNRTMVTIGTGGAVLLLLAAFLVVWLVPRGPEVSSATAQIAGSSGQATSSLEAQKSGALASQAGTPAGAPIGEQPHISVQGLGVVSAKPDMASMQIGVQIQRDTLAAAQSDAATRMDAAVKSLKAAGIDNKDISTAQYTVEPVMDYSRQNQPPAVIGFRVTNILSVKIRDISKAGKIIDDQIKSGANTVYGVSFGFSDPSAIVKQARQAAMNDARDKATQLASLGGVTLGAPILIDEGGANVPPPVQQASPGVDKGAQPAPTTPINPGQQEVRVTVSVVYAIK